MFAIYNEINKYYSLYIVGRVSKVTTDVLWNPQQRFIMILKNAKEKPNAVNIFVKYIIMCLRYYLFSTNTETRKFINVIQHLTVIVTYLIIRC